MDTHGATFMGASAESVKSRVDAQDEAKKWLDEVDVLNPEMWSIVMTHKGFSIMTSDLSLPAAGHAMTKMMNNRGIR